MKKGGITGSKMPRFSLRSLRMKLLLLTILFVLIAEALVFIPSVSKHRVGWLQERIERAYIASESLEMAPETVSIADKAKRLFASAEILGVTIERNGRSELIAAPDLAMLHDARLSMLDLQQRPWPRQIADAISVMFSSERKYFLVSSRPAGEPEVMLEIVVDSAPLKTELWRFARNIIGVSLAICFIVASLIYLALSYLFVRPMVRVTENIARFQAKPEDASRLLRPSGRQDEIGDAERVLAQMQSELRMSLRRKTNLATLGEGMSKVNHDLRNILASAVLMSDRLAKSDDPRVQKLTPKLVQALDRAVALCKATLEFGRVDDLDKEHFNAFDFTEEIGEALKMFTEHEDQTLRLRFINNVHPDVMLYADRLHLFRAVLNLARNGAEAVSDKAGGQVLIDIDQSSGGTTLRVTDNGSGIPQAAREHLFTPFKGSQKSGGSGLGLAIAMETVIDHGGVLSLERSDQDGTIFRVDLLGA